MKRVIMVVLAAVLIVALVPTAIFAAKPGTDFNGAHQTLNLVGKDKVMPGDYSNPDRGTMFVPADTADFEFDLNTPNNLELTSLAGIKITVTQGDEFAVIDGNATDGYGAFQLGPGKYSCYIAVKAKDAQKSGVVNITGWVQAYDNLGTLWYYLNVGSVSVSKNKNNYEDATGLFFVSDAEDPFGIVTGTEGMWVFDYLTNLGNITYDPGTGEVAQYSDLAYFWQLQNDGAKLIQVRFYPMQ